MKVDVSHEDAVIDCFARDKSLAINYLNSVLEDGTIEEIITALNRILRANSFADRINGIDHSHENTFGCKNKNSELTTLAHH